MSQIGGTELVLVLLVLLVLFGAKRLPELSRSVGRSARILKNETRALREDGSAGEVPAAAGGPVTTSVHQEPVAAPRPAGASHQTD